MEKIQQRALRHHIWGGGGIYNVYNLHIRSAKRQGNDALNVCQTSAENLAGTT